jgi:hypothetical protein
MRRPETFSYGLEHQPLETLKELIERDDDDDCVHGINIHDGINI